LNALAVLNDSRRYRGKTRKNSQSSSKRIFDSFSHKLHHWFSFCNFLWQLLLLCKRSTADVFFARVFETQIVDSWGEKKKRFTKPKLWFLLQVFANVGSLAQSNMQDVERTWILA
jgi:hypothetical protein